MTNSVKIKSWDVVNALRDNSAADFGTLTAKLRHIKDLCDMLKSSIELNEGATKWDLERIDEIKGQAEICNTLTDELFGKLNYCISIDRS